MKEPCPASISGVCLKLSEGFGGCSISDDECEYMPTPDDFGPDNQKLLSLLAEGGEATDLRFSFADDGEMSWEAMVVMPVGWKLS